MAEKLEEQLKELGSKLVPLPSSKDALVKLLKQGAACLSELDQSPPKSVMDSMQPLLNAISKPELLKHQDREVNLFVASCFCEITRITAPEAPYDDDVLKDSFQVIVSSFSGLRDINGPSFGRRVVILETLAKYRSCVVMLDLECDDLINEMIKIFLAEARDEHPENVLTSMQTIIEVLIEESEDVQESLLLILLSVLGRDKKDVTTAARKIAMNVIKNCAAKLEPGIKQFLVSSISGESRSLKPEINYHDVLYDIYSCAPQILSGIVPHLTGELLSDQLDIRLKAVSLVGDLFAVPGSTISEAFGPVFLEFLKRLTDRVVEVRLSVLEYVKNCLLENPSRAEAHQIISALCERFLDYDENVRKQVVSVVCDVACHSLTSIPVDTIKLVAERLRDKSVLVKRYTMERLADIYRVSRANESSAKKNDEYDWIVGKILRCFYDKDFRSDVIEPILSISLFPTDYSVEDKVTNWVGIFSGFDKVEVKALEKILEQKQRLQQEMLKYLSLRQLPQEGDGTEIQKKVLFCFRVMSHCFSDPAKAEENFQVLDQLKDSNIWKILTPLLDPNTSSLQATSSRDELLKILGQNHRLYEFTSTLSLKCSYLLFDKDHVKEILKEAGVQKSSESNELIVSCMTILVIIARFCPSLLGGIEEDLVHLLEDDNEIIKEGTLHILAKAGGTIREQLGVSSRSLDLILERICIEGSRRQAKYAVHALASITKDDGLMSLSVLYKRLVDMLEEESHLPAVLQSLGCIAQAAMPVFETRESEVEKFIKGNILERKHIIGDKTTDCWDDRSELCSLKIFGLKALVKSYLPVKDAHLRSGIDDLIVILKNILMFGDISREIESSLVDRAHMKLAAAKAVLRLSKHWEQKIPVDVLYLTLGISEDNFPEVKRLFLDKVYQYVKDRILDPKNACAFLLDFSSPPSDLEENKRYLSDIIQMCRQLRGRQISLQTDAISPPTYPESILPYVVHSLAHHPLFPNIDEGKDVKVFEPMYRQLYLFLSMMVHGDADGKSEVSISKDKETISLLTSIFLSIKRSEDALDAARSKNLYALCDLGIPIIKRLALNQDFLEDSSASVTLPSVLYKPFGKKEENDSLVGEQKTWLADEGVLAHFESLQLEVNGIVNTVNSEDDVMKDIDIEGSEMPLGKLLKRLKAKAAKAKKEVKNEPAQAGVARENDFDILKMVKEINTDNTDGTNKFESSNGHEFVRKKKRSDHGFQKRKSMFSESTEDVPVPKRKRTSSKKGSKRPTNVNQENVNVDLDKMDEEPQHSSENQSMQGKSDEHVDSDQQASPVIERSGPSSKKKGKTSDRRSTKAVNHSPDAKSTKKVSESGGTRLISHSKSGSIKKEKPKTMAGLGKCTTKDSQNSIEDLIGCRIKVWWPMDKKFYEGVVKSFDSQKMKHVILYDDGEVEVLRLERERWELVDKDKKTKQSGSAKNSRPKGGSSEQKRKSIGSSKEDGKMEEKSSGQKRKSIGGSKQDEKIEEKPSGKKRKTTAGVKQDEKVKEKSSGQKKKSIEGSKQAEDLEEKLSQIRRKRTPRKSSKQRQKIMSKIETSKESGESPEYQHPEISTKSPVDDSDSDKEQKEKSSADEELTDKDKKQEEDIEKGSNDAEPKEEVVEKGSSDAELKEDGNDSEDTQSDDRQDAHESDNEAVSSSEKKLPNESEEESGQKADEDDDMGSRPIDKPGEENSDSASGSTDAELSDDEPLSTWTQRSGKK